MRRENEVARVSGICLASGGGGEGLRGHTAPGFRVGDKFFVMVGEDRSSITFKAGPGVQEALISGDPERLEIAELIEDSYRLIAPKRLAAQLDDR